MNPKAAKYIFFLIGPFFSLPFIILDILKKNKAALTMLAFLIGILSFLYIPRYSNDKAYYYLLYEQLNSIEFNSFLLYLFQAKTDFIFYFLVYFFSILNIPLQYLFLILTFITVKIWFDVYYKTVSQYNINSKEFLLFYLFILFSFSLAGLLSGVRFYFAISLSLLGLYNGIILQKRMNGFLLIVIAGLTHFSCLVFFPAYIALILFSKNFKLFKYLFFISFVFIFIPRDFLQNLFSSLNLFETHQTKVDSYLGESDSIENSIAIGNFNNYLRYFFKTLWVYFAYVYLFLTRKNNSSLRNLLFISLTIANVFFSAPTVYNRYLILAQGVFILLLIEDYFQNIRFKKFLNILFLVVMFNFLGNVYAMRDIFKKSYLKKDNILLTTILFKEDITSNDFIMR